MHWNKNRKISKVIVRSFVHLMLTLFAFIQEYSLRFLLEKSIDFLSICWKMKIPTCKWISLSFCRTRRFPIQAKSHLNEAAKGHCSHTHHLKWVALHEAFENENGTHKHNKQAKSEMWTWEKTRELNDKSAIGMLSISSVIWRMSVDSKWPTSTQTSMRHTKIKEIKKTKRKSKYEKKNVKQTATRWERDVNISAFTQSFSSPTE